MARIGKFLKASGERKRYIVDYSDWLDEGETVQSVSFDIDGEQDYPVVVDGYVLTDDSLGVSFFVSAGTTDQTYEILITVETTGGQVKEDAVLFQIVDP